MMMEMEHEIGTIQIIQIIREEEVVVATAEVEHQLVENIDYQELLL
jgi:hypothetical protein